MSYLPESLITALPRVFHAVVFSERMARRRRKP